MSIIVPSCLLCSNSFLWATIGAFSKHCDSIAKVFKHNHQAECDDNEKNGKPPEPTCSSKSLAKGDIDISPLDITWGNHCFTCQPMVKEFLFELFLSLVLIISIIEYFLGVSFSIFKHLLSSCFPLHGSECHVGSSILAVSLLFTVELGHFIFVVKFLLLVLDINLFEFSILLDEVDDLLVHKLHRIILLILASHLVDLVNQDFLFAVKRIHRFKKICLITVVFLENNIRDFPGTFLLDATKLERISL